MPLVQLGDPSSSIGAFDAIVGVASGLYQTYDILNRNLPLEDENLELGNAWVTVIPVVGDFAQGLITGSQAFWEGDKGKALEAGLWVTIGVMGCVPGGQIPAVVIGLTLAAKPLAAGVYDASQAHNLIEAWIESGKWSKTKPRRLEGLLNRKGGLHKISHKDLLTEKGDVYYKSERIKSLFFKEVQISDSIRAYADQHIMHQYPAIASLRDALKVLFPDFKDKDWNHPRIVAIKIEARGAKGGKMLYKAYDIIRKKAYAHTLSHLKKWAEDEMRAAKDYEVEVARLRKELEALQAELKVSSLIHADETVNAYKRVVKNVWEQESLSLSKLRIYESYVKSYKKIAGQMRRVNDLFRQASSHFIPASWHFTGYPVFDTERADNLLTEMERGRKGVLQHMQVLLKELNQEKTVYDPGDKCHKKAFDILAGKRYKLAFMQNLINYYKEMYQGSSAWADAYDRAKEQYEETRDRLSQAPGANLTGNAESGAFMDAFTAFVIAAPYSLAYGDVEVYRQMANSYEAKLHAAKKSYEIEKAVTTSGEAGKALSQCLLGNIKIGIELSEENPESETEITATVKLLKGSPPKEKYWIWFADGGLAISPKSGEKVTVKATSDGTLTLKLVDHFNWKRANTLGETSKEITVKEKKEAGPISLTIVGPHSVEHGERASFTLKSSSSLNKLQDLRIKWFDVNRNASLGDGQSLTIQQAKEGIYHLKVVVWAKVKGRSKRITDADHTLTVKKPKKKKEEEEPEKEKEPGKGKTGTVKGTGKVTFSGTAAAIWEGGNNPKGFYLKRKEAKTGAGSKECQWKSQVNAEMWGKTTTFFPKTEKDILARLEGDVKEHKRWGKEAKISPSPWEISRATSSTRKRDTRAGVGELLPVTRAQAQWHRATAMP